jgi:hypothetical protein
MTWNLVYLNYVEGEWVPIETLVEPMIHYGRYYTPLSPEQFDKLANPPATK